MNMLTKTTVVLSSPRPKRRGRKRKIGDRHPGSGRLVQPKRADDPGPEKVQAIRHYLSGSSDHSKIPLSCPLDVLLAQGAISEDQHKAGSDYAQLRLVQAKIAGLDPHPGASDLARGDRSTPDLVERPRDLARGATLQLIHQALFRTLPRRARDLLENVALYQRYPAFLDGDQHGLLVRPSFFRDIQLLLDALDCVHRVLGQQRTIASLVKQKQAQAQAQAQAAERVREFA